MGEKLPCAVCNQPYRGRDFRHAPGWEWTRHVAHGRVCRECVRQGRALPADPEEQDFPVMEGPYRAWFDQRRLCGYCGQEFVFTAQDQRFWYEERRIPLHVVPVGCPTCRRRVRQQKRANRLLAERLRQLDRDSVAGLQEVAELEVQVGSVSRALEFLRRALKRAADSEISTALRGRSDSKPTLHRRTRGPTPGPGAVRGSPWSSPATGSRRSSGSSNGRRCCVRGGPGPRGEEGRPRTGGGPAAGSSRYGRACG